MPRIRNVQVAAIVAFLATLLACGAANALLLSGPTNDLTGSGAITAPALFEDWLFLASPAGGAVTITATTSDAAFRVEFLLFDPNNVPVAAATAPGPGQDVVAFDIPMALTGIYTLRVDGFNSTIGNYLLSVIGNSDASVHSLQSVPEPAPMSLLGLAVPLALLQGRRRRAERRAA